MMEETLAGIGAIKSVLDIVGYWKNLDDTVKRDVVVAELYPKIISAYTEQLALVDRVRELEKERASSETWTAEQQKYELKTLGVSAFAYMLKPSCREAEPPHWVCAKCFKEKKIHIIQHRSETSRQNKYFCPNCKTEIQPGSSVFAESKIMGALGELTARNIKWLD